VRTPFKHLTMTDRLRIEKYLRDGMKPREIAAILRVHISTVYREMQRGKYQRMDKDTLELKEAYSPDIADQRYRENLRNKGPGLKIGNDYELANYIEQTIIERDCSPAAAMGYAQNEGRQFKTKISVNTIYSYIHKGVFLRLTMADCPRRGKQKGKYQKVQRDKSARAPAGESIDNRPEEVRERKEFGHWEMDTIYSSKKGGAAALLTITERKTRKEIIISIPDRRAETIIQALDALEQRHGADRFRLIFRSITVDNGGEFSATDMIEASCMEDAARTKVYYCHAYHSWERGSNEVQNGMIRRKHPKGTDFREVTPEEIAATEEWMNNYPRRILGYRSSEMAYRDCLAELGIAV